MRRQNTLGIKCAQNISHNVEHKNYIYFRALPLTILRITNLEKKVLRTTDLDSLAPLHFPSSPQKIELKYTSITLCTFICIPLILFLSSSVKHTKK